MDPLQLALPLTVGFGMALALAPLVGRGALRVGAVDRPSARGVNDRPDMPLLGGIAVAAAFLAALTAIDLVAAPISGPGRWFGLAAGGATLIAAGVWDDRFGMSAVPKLAAQMTAAALAISSGFVIDRLSDPFSMKVVELPSYVAWPASMLWIVGVTNAMNLLDGLDGLASGVGAIMAATLTAIAWQADQSFAVCMGLALVGALLGFLPHNFPPARIFLGDTGSMFIGFTLSLLALEGYRRVSLITFVVPLLALAVPLLDTSMSILRRLRTRTPIFTADRLHMHHRLLDIEGSPRSAVLQLYLVTAAFCLIAISFTRLQGVTALVFLLAVVVLTLRLLWNLGALDRQSGPADESKGGDS